jgi:hypothetical protein
MDALFFSWNKGVCHHSTQRHGVSACLPVSDVSLSVYLACGCLFHSSFVCLASSLALGSLTSNYALMQRNVIRLCLRVVSLDQMEHPIGVN